MNFFTVSGTNLNTLTFNTATTDAFVSASRRSAGIELDQTATGQTTIEVPNGLGSGFVFVPTASIVSNNTTNLNLANAVLPRIDVTVSSDIRAAALGKIVKLTMTGIFTNSGITSANVKHMKIQFSVPNNDLSLAKAPLSGTGINNYEIADKAQVFDGTLIESGFVDATSAAGTAVKVTDDNWNAFVNATNTTGVIIDFATAQGTDLGNYAENYGLPGAPKIQRILAATNYLVAFAAPDDPNTADAVKRYAYGVPMFDYNTTTGESTIQGVRILNPGEGYQVGVSYKMYLVPNIYQDAARAVTGAPAYKLPSNQNIAGVVLKGWTEAASGIEVFSKSFTAKRQTSVSPRMLKITLSNTGEGYTEDPKVVVYGGGYSFIHFGNSDWKISASVRAGKINSLSGSHPRDWPENYGSWSSTDNTLTLIDNVSFDANGRAFFELPNYGATNASVPSVAIIDEFGNSITKKFAELSATSRTG